jgi:hypothetical protein
MEATVLREELITYIQLADEKKLKALHTLLMPEQEEIDYKWWKDEAFVKELNEDYKKYESGEEPGYTEEEVYARMNEKLEKRRTANV